MSRRHTVHDASGIVSEHPGLGGILHACGPTVPTDGTAGYAPGCIFQDLNASAGAQFFINEGSATSCDFNASTVPGVSLSGLTATAVHLNQAVGNGDEVVTTTNAIDSTLENGRTYYLSLAGGFTTTLPAPILGLRFRFIVKTAPTTAYVITTNGGANVIYGHFLERAGGAGVAGAAQDTQNFVANQAIIGDWAEYYCDGTNWYVHGIVDVAAGATFAVT